MHDKQPIPVTPLVSLYRTLRQTSQREQLVLAQEMLADVSVFVRAIRESIEVFSSYENESEPFCPRHASLVPPAAIVSGRSLAEALAVQSRLVVENDPNLRVSVVDYEVPPARTTINALTQLNRFADGTPSTRTMKADLLLRHPDGTPIIGEAKVATKRAYDTTSFLALVQALAAATQFATKSQRRRLAKHYPHVFAPSGAVDAAVVTYRPAEAARAKYQERLDAAAREIANAAVGAGFPPELRQILFISVSGGPGALRLRREPAAGFDNRGLG